MFWENHVSEITRARCDGLLYADATLKSHANCISSVSVVAAVVVQCPARSVWVRRREAELQDRARAWWRSSIWYVALISSGRS